MLLQRKRRPSRMPAALVLFALLAMSPAAGAADPDWPGETDEGWRKVIAYARCALEVFGAVSPAQWTGAILDCGRQFLDEPPVGVGGL